MTEAEWLAAKHPEAMLDFLGRKATQRKLRLFGAACARSAFAYPERWNWCRRWSR
jgi:hypothetical protein